MLQDQAPSPSATSMTTTRAVLQWFKSVALRAAALRRTWHSHRCCRLQREELPNANCSAWNCKSLPSSRQERPGRLVSSLGIEGSYVRSGSETIIRHWGSDGQGPPKTAHVTRHGPGTTKRLNPRGPRAVWAENFCCFACCLLPNDISTGLLIPRPVPVGNNNN